MINASAQRRIVECVLSLINPAKERDWYAKRSHCVPVDELDMLDLMEHHRERIEDAVQDRAAAFFR